MRLRGWIVSGACVALIVGATPVSAAPRAKLIHVHVFKTAGKPSPTVANCSPDQTAKGGFAYTGWEIAGDLTAHLNVSTVPAGLGTIQAFADYIPPRP